MKLKNKIVMVTALIAVTVAMSGMVAMTETAVACPNQNSNLYTEAIPYTYLFAKTSDLDNIRTYILDTVDKSGASVIEYCVYPKDGFSGNDAALTPLYIGPEDLLWKIDHPGSKPYFGFERTHGNPNNLPVDGTKNIDVGKADYDAGKPDSEVILFHINDPDECSKNIAKENDDTCWRKPGQPQQQSGIPEFPAIALPIVAVLGLMLILQRRK